MEITQEIKELIQKQLPGLHASALKEFIEDSEKTLKAFEALKKTQKDTEVLLSEAREVIKKNTEIVTNATKIVERETVIRDKELLLEKEEFKFSIEKKLLELRATEAEKRANDAVTTMTLLVKNPVLSEHFFESKMTPGSTTYHKDGTYTSHSSGDVVNERNQSRELTKE